MYGVSETIKEEKNSAQVGMTAYMYLLNHDDTKLSKTRKTIRSYPDGKSIEDDVVDALIDMLITHDYSEERAINYQIGCVKSIDSYIRDCIKYSYKKIHSKVKRRGEVSMESSVSKHSYKESDSEEGSKLEDFIEDTRTKVEVKMPIECAVNKLIRANNTIYDGIIVMYLVQDKEEKQRQTVLDILGIGESTRKIANDSEIYEVMQDLGIYSIGEVKEELINQYVGAEQLIYAVDNILAV